jgi:hypothetical protein
VTALVEEDRPAHRKQRGEREAAGAGQDLPFRLAQVAGEQSKDRDQAREAERPDDGEQQDSPRPHRSKYGLAGDYAEAAAIRKVARTGCGSSRLSTASSAATQRSSNTVPDSSRRSAIAASCVQAGRYTRGDTSAS